MTVFTDHGIPAPADETRTAAVCRRQDGSSRIVIAARGFVVIADPDSGKSLQVYFPDGLNDYPFDCLGTADGMFYVGAGDRFYALDPFAGRFVWSTRTGVEGEIAAFRMAEDDRGRVYIGAYPTCTLRWYDPAQRSLEELVRMDEREKYPFAVAVDRLGWVYVGIGTERRDLVAYEPATGRMNRLLPEVWRTRGSGHAHRGLDGHVYGYAEMDEQGNPCWLRLYGGEAEPVRAEDVSEAGDAGEGFQKVRGGAGDDLYVERCDLAERELVVRLHVAGDGTQTGSDSVAGAGGMTAGASHGCHVPNGSKAPTDSRGSTDTDAYSRVELRLEYESQGAALSPLTLGPDGRVYGTSNHPLHLYAFDPAADTFTRWGGHAVEKGGGGNLCAYAAQGSILAGAAYAGGYLHLLDTSMPIRWDVSDAAERNPRLVAAHPEIFRPRCALALADGEHIVYGGFPGYGSVGGALCLYNVRTGEDKLLPNEEIVPDQSTLCLVQLPDGSLLGGTSVETPGGADPKAVEAVLYVLDWRTRTVTKRWTPIPGAREISLIKNDAAGIVHGIASDSVYFALNPQTGTVIARQDLSEWGSVVRDGLIMSPDGTMLGALSRALFRVDTGRCEAVKLAEPPEPVTAGLASTNGRLFYASGSHLWSFCL